MATLTALEQGKTSDPGFFKLAKLAATYSTSLDDLATRVHTQAQAQAHTEVEATDQPVAVEAQDMPMPPHGMISIGYEGRSIEGFVASLLAAGATTVADVRLNAISRKAGFSKTRLRTALAAAGIDYLHYRTLGNPRHNREPFWTDRIAEGRDVYRELLSGHEQAAALNDLGDLADHQVVAVMCFERDHERCHRQVVIDELMQHKQRPVRTLPAHNHSRH